ncbi:MAG: DUF4238 domain-containing protein [Candidatus Gracilibacteria bacterium]
MQKIEELSKEQKIVIKLFLESDSLDLKDFISKNNCDVIFDEIHIKDLNDIAKFKIQPTKYQHYVQKAYLDLFKNPNNKQGEVNILDLKLRKVVKSKVSKGLCVEDYFYGIESGKQDMMSQIIEWYLCKYENNFLDLEKRISKQILENNSSKLDEKDIYELCVYISLTLMRTKNFREEMGFDDDKIFDTLGIKKKDNLTHIQFLFNSENVYGFGNLLFNKKINIYYLKGLERNFVTSENPVLQVVPEYEKNPRGVHFMKRIHYFPLNPNILFEFLPYKSGKKIKKILIQKNDRVTYYNLIRSIDSHYLYSNNKDNFISEEYTIARSNYIDELYKIFGNHSKLDEDYKVINQLKEKYKGKSFIDNYEMFKYYENEELDFL